MGELDVVWHEVLAEKPRQLVVVVDQKNAHGVLWTLRPAPRSWSASACKEV
jgi:hypothetical protein